MKVGGSGDWVVFGIKNEGFGINATRFSPIRQKKFIVSQKCGLALSAGWFQPQHNHPVHQIRNTHSQRIRDERECVVLGLGKARADDLHLCIGAIVETRRAAPRRKQVKAKTQRAHSEAHNRAVLRLPDVRGVAG